MAIPNTLGQEFRAKIYPDPEDRLYGSQEAEIRSSLVLAQSINA